MAKRYPDLATYLDKTGTRQEDFAALVESTQAHISRIASGEIVPRPELAERIATQANIPLDSFTLKNLAWRREQEVAS